MSELFAIANLTGGQLNAIVKKLGGHEGALRFLRDLYVLALPPHISIWKTVRLVGTEEEAVDLLMVTTKQLTGKNHAEMGEIFDVINLVGQLCSKEVAAAVPMQCFNSYQGEREMFMIPLELQDRDPEGFWVVREGDRISVETLSVHRGAGAYENDRFVFRVRK